MLMAEQVRSVRRVKINLLRNDSVTQAEVAAADMKLALLVRGRKSRIAAEKHQSIKLR